MERSKARQDLAPFTGRQSEHTAIFLHIPKTAGTTLSHIVERQYSRRQFYTIKQYAGPFSGPPDAFRQLPVERRTSLRLVKGHVAFGLHKELSQPCSYFTLLREPTARVLSHYAHARRDPSHNLHLFVKKTPLAQALVQRAHTAQAFDNFQTRLISGVWNTVPFGALDEGVLALAINNLRCRFAVVGLVERFDESLLLLQRHYGWRAVYYTRHNTGARRASRAPDDETLALVRRHNRLDYRLYEEAAALCARQIAAAGKAFPAELRRFRRVNQLVSPFLHLYWQARKLSLRQAFRRAISRA